MATLKPELKKILDKYGIDPHDKSQVWDCRGTLVLYHKAYERIAAWESIVFDPPSVIRADRDEAVVLVVGRMGERAEWSFGEAVINLNYRVSGNQAGYPWAMAEKRAKDRVIAKLVGLAEYVYSEDEADEFKEARPAAANGTPQTNGAAPVDPSDWETLFQDLLTGALKRKTVEQVNEYWGGQEDDRANLHKHAPELYKTLVDRVKQHRAKLAQEPVA